MVNLKNNQITKNKNVPKISQKVAKKPHPIVHKTINIYNYTSPADLNEKSNPKRKISDKSKSTKTTRNRDTQTPKRGITKFMTTKTFRNRAIQATEGPQPTEKDKITATENSQQNILNFVHDSENILGLLTDYMDFISDNEDQKDVDGAILCKEELRHLFTGYFMDKNDFIEKLDSDILSFESAIWVLFTHHYLSGTTGRKSDSKISQSRLTKFFIDHYFHDENNEPMLE